MRHALVVGAGVAGLAAATGLRRTGWQVTVLEQASQLGEVGAGLSLWPNAQAALETLGFTDQVAALAIRPSNGNIRDTRGRPLLRIDQNALRCELGREVVAVHRAQLHEMLLEPVADRVRPNAQVTTGSAGSGSWPYLSRRQPRADMPDPGRPDTEVADVDLSNVEEAGVDLVVGADGIDSQVRAAHWPAAAPAVYSGFTAWRGICDPDELPNPSVVGAPQDAGDPAAAGISWGRGKEFGLVPLADGRIYWYAAMAAPEGAREHDERAAVLREFAWHWPIPEVVRATPPERVLRNDLRQLPAPLPTYRSGRVVLVGDAAHAMMPGLGQGACQALEDAAVLAFVCDRHDDLDHALDRYDAERRPRSQRIAQLSWRASRYGPLARNPLATGLRDLSMRLMPSSLMIRVMAGPSRWSPPRRS